MLIKVPALHEPPASEITPRRVYLNRRTALAGLGLAAASPLVLSQAAPGGGKLPKLPGTHSAVPGAMVMDKITSYADATSYNNFYEFGTDKSDPAANAHTLKPRPWTVSIEGECAKPGRYDLDALLKLAPMEERVYRLRCVEGWSMVIPWVGYSLSEIIKKVEPTSKAKYVEFTSLADKAQMPGVRSGVLYWPYVEGLRIDEAMHPLTILAVGLYGEVLPNQNGAPVRLVVPWKYGFKSAKSIVRIRFVERQPLTTWERSVPGEYGFYSNVNPSVDHVRWAQQKERRIPNLAANRPTQLFNGYGDQVAHLYAGLDLKKFF